MPKKQSIESSSTTVKVKKLKEGVRAKKKELPVDTPTSRKNTMPISVRRTDVNYINNAEFYAAFKVYVEERKSAIQSGSKLPVIPNYIARCYMKIAGKLASKSNFCRYTFKDDMISDAIESCVTYTKNFNPDKSTNPFSYFTQVCYCAFIRRIDMEKKQYYVRAKSMQQNSALNLTFDHDANGSGEDTPINGFQMDNNGFNQVIENFENRQKNKIAKKSMFKKKAKEDRSLDTKLFAG